MINTDAILGSGADIRTLVKEVVVNATPMDVWAAWTSEEGINAWWGPAGSNIELRVGGPFEIFFSMQAPEGQRGSEGCRFLSYVPGEMVSFTWNAPPQLKLRQSNTWVVLSFLSDGSGTKVRLTHTGFLNGADWDEYMAYFENAWTYVLQLLADHWTE